jgi:hypothetical protein
MHKVEGIGTTDGRVVLEPVWLRGGASAPMRDAIGHGRDELTQRLAAFRAAFAETAGAKQLDQLHARRAAFQAEVVDVKKKLAAAGQELAQARRGAGNAGCSHAGIALAFDRAPGSVHGSSRSWAALVSHSRHEIPIATARCGGSSH